MTELFFGSLLVTTGKDMRVNFSSDSVDIDGKIVVSNSSVSSFNGPQGFRESVDSGGWVDNNLGPIESEAHPVQWVVPSVANVTSDFTEFRVENWVSTLAFHVISRLIKVTNSWNVTFLLFTQNISVVIDVN